MDIAPIAGVRAISLQHQPKTGTPPEAQFKIDCSERMHDDTYSPDREENQDLAEEGTEIAEPEDSSPAEATHPLPEGSTIDLIA